MKEYIDDTTWKLIAKHLDNELNTQEKEQFAQWLDESPENRKELKNAEKIWHLSDQREQRLFDTDYGWKIMEKRMGQPSVKQAVTKKIRFRYAMAIAASIMLLAVISFAIYMIVGNVQYIKVVAENQKLATPVVLPDGSHVFLNAHSTLRYPKAFGSKTRTVKLTGEAFFEVTKNPRQPFIIQTEKAQVKVLGTSFNVMAYNKSDSVQVLVETGVVELSSRSTSNAIRLIPGNTGVYYKQSEQLVLNKNSDVNTIAWKTNVLIFRNANLDYVVQTLKKTFAQPISIEDGRLKNCRLNADFKNRDLGNILDAIKETLNLTVKKTGNKYVLTGPGC